MSKELKIGIFAAAVLIVSFFMINYLRGKDLFNREYDVYARFESVEGLVASAPVYIKGYKVGKVSDVSYDPSSEDFKVTCSVSKDFLIPSDSRFTIYSVDIMGGKGVKIDLGNSSVYAVDGDMLTPSFEAGLMDGLASDLGPLLNKVSNTLDSLTITVSGVNSILSDQNRTYISGILANLESTSAGLNRLAKAVGNKTGEIDSVIDNISNLSSKLTNIADQVDTTLTGVNSFIGTVNETDLEGLVSSLQGLLENINNPDGTIGRLMTDDSVYDSVNSLISEIDELVKKMQENPKKYMRISVF